MYSTIIKQLEKALECKDDKELRLRVEVLLDMIKEQQPVWTTYPSQPAQPLPTYYDTTSEPAPKTPYKVTSGVSGTKVNGAGSISSVNSEQINYKRPKGT